MGQATTRRDFLRQAAWAAAAVVTGSGQARASEGPKERPPNVLVILTDQQHAGMMSCAGNTYLKTPAMDSLAATGTRFERAYATNPVCLPARFSFLTGRYPSAVGIRHNGTRGVKVPEAYIQQSLGMLLRNAGYDVAYGGKVHLPPGMRDVRKLGFERLTGDQRDRLAEACAAFIRRKHRKPFFLFASFINPHDICYMAIRAHRKSARVPAPLDAALKRPEGVSEKEFFAKHCPPAPANFEPPADEPEAIRKFLVQRPFKDHVRRNWSKQTWRLHRWAYCRLTERVDAQIGKVLAALRETRQEAGTLVVFTSDHGDMDSAYRMEHKSVLYEDSARVPLIVSFKGKAPGGRVDDKHLVSVGLDLLVTLCDYAGIAPPKGLLGRSVRPLAEGRPVESWRGFLIAESEIGRMVRTERYKYCVYNPGRNREQLFDLQTDPGEMNSLVKSPQHRAVLARHRKLLRDWVAKTADRIGREYLVDAPKGARAAGRHALPPARRRREM